MGLLKQRLSSHNCFDNATPPVWSLLMSSVVQITVQRSGASYTATIVRTDDVAFADRHLWDDVARDGKHGGNQTAPVIVDLCEYFASPSDGVPRSPRGGQQGEWKQTYRWNAVGRGLEQQGMLDAQGKEKFTPSGVVTISAAHQAALQDVMGKASLIFDLDVASIHEIAEAVKAKCSEEYELSQHQADGLAKALKAKQCFIEQSENKAKRTAAAKLEHMANAERALILVGDVDFVDEPIAAFVRLRTPIPHLSGLSTEESDENRPTRFLFFLLGPPGTMLHHEFKEMGRACALAFQNDNFSEATKRTETRASLLGNLKGFAETAEIVSMDAKPVDEDEGGTSALIGLFYPKGWCQNPSPRRAS